MEDSFLHKAHAAGRQAVKFQRKGLFEKAAERHLIAANLLYELQERIPKDSLCVCSLEEQSKYHKRQAELALIVREISDKVASKQGLTMADKGNMRTPQQNLQMNRVLSEIAQHEVQILKNIDEADSLLQILTNTEDPSSPMGGKSSNTMQKLGGFTIRPRKDAEVIEELQTVNLNLRTLVDNLMKQLQECREENEQLRTKLQMYEPIEKKSVISSEVLMAYEDLPSRELPELAPLEEPVFDFSAYV